MDNGKETAIKLWVDESTEVSGSHILVGYLITDCDGKEYSFFKELTDRRKELKCFTTLHGREIKKREINLFDKWLEVFNSQKYNQGIYFHAFLYERNEDMISKDKTFEHYFAKQSIFALALKMKGGEHFDKHVSKMFEDVQTLTILFDNRSDHIAEVISRDKHKNILRIPQLEDIYRKEITEQIEKQTRKSSKTNDLTVRFSFVSDECFDGIQFTDCFLYAIRQKLEGNQASPLVRIFDKHFLDLSEDVVNLGFQEIYKWDKKFNFFQIREKK